MHLDLEMIYMYSQDSPLQTGRNKITYFVLRATSAVRRRRFVSTMY